MGKGRADPPRPLMHTKSWFWLLAGPFSPLSLLSLGIRGTLGSFTLWAISPAGEIGSSKVPLESSVCIHRYRVLTGELKHPWILVSEAVPRTNSRRCGGVNAYHIRCIYWPKQAHTQPRFKERNTAPVNEKSGEVTVQRPVPIVRSCWRPSDSLPHRLRVQEVLSPVTAPAIGFLSLIPRNQP